MPQGISKSFFINLLAFQFDSFLVNGAINKTDKNLSILSFVIPKTVK